jgi:hypothetical protein
VTVSGPTPGELKRLRARAGGAQATFAVPEARAADFAAVLVHDGVGDRGARVTIENVAMPPSHLGALLGRPDAGFVRETTIDAAAGEARGLLSAMLAEWIDFWFVPSPGGFLLYADHDEYATVFAPKPGAVSRVAQGLTAAGFETAADFTRRFG